MTDIEKQYADLDCLNIENEAMYSEVKRLRAEVERLKAAIAWTREVRPGKNGESGGAIVNMTWDQFNAMRDLAEPKP